MDEPAIAEQVNREPVTEDPVEFPLSQEQLYRLEAITAQVMEPLLNQAKEELLSLEQAAHCAVELAFHVMNKARECRLLDGKIVWKGTDV